MYILRLLNDGRYLFGWELPNNRPIPCRSQSWAQKFATLEEARKFVQKYDIEAEVVPCTI